jgi:hypothetical protein
MRPAAAVAMVVGGDDDTGTGRVDVPVTVGCDREGNDRVDTGLDEHTSTEMVE